MNGSDWSSISPAHVATDLLMVLLSLALAAAFGALARRHFSAGSNRRGWGMVPSAVTGVATPALWQVCAVLGIVAFFRMNGRPVAPAASARSYLEEGGRRTHAPGGHSVGPDSG